MSKKGRRHLSRRDFIKSTTAFIGGLISTAFGVPVLGYLLAPALREEEVSDVINLGPLENYPVGVPTPFSITQTRVNGWERTAKVIGMYVVRMDDGSVRVFSDICTHLGCLVTWHPETHDYISPCHDGHFDIDGFVTKGPPPRPLDEFETKVEGGILFVMNPPIRRSN